MSEVAELDTAEPETPRTRALWVPFWIGIGILALVIALPIALSTSAPERDPEAIGILEQVPLVGASGAGFPGVGGYVAAEGWHWDDPETKEVLWSPNGDVQVSARLISEVADPVGALRSQVPAGAVLAPVETATTTTGFREYTIVEDLAAGDSVTKRTLVCAETLPAGCVEFTVIGSGNTDVDASIRGMIESVEVL